MKRFTKLAVVTVASTLLVACQAQSTTESSKASSSQQAVTTKQEITATLKTTDINGKSTEYTLKTEEGGNLMDAMKAGLNIEEKDGMITAINGVKQDDAQKVYWMYKVNGEMASVGASQYILKDGDRVEFYQEAM